MNYKSICGSEVITGSAKHIESCYAALAYEALRAGDHVQAHIYFQHSEHWKRMQTRNDKH